jgi:hypothetical protein
MHNKRRFLFSVLAPTMMLIGALGCEPRKLAPTITLEDPKKGYWFLSEKFPYQFMRIELYEKHVEGLASLTMEFRIKAESPGATWQETNGAVQIDYLKPEKGQVTITPVRDQRTYQGRYRNDKIDLTLVEVRIGRNSKMMYFTESEEKMDKLLREKNKLRLDVVWGPTQKDVYNQMFAYTKPIAGEIMYDLGCGDARILVAAASRYKIRGIGYDLDPKLIERGKLMAKQQGVSELIDLRTENLFAADLSNANIVAIYLSDRINQKLKPKFFRELKPGTRVVSHNWHMGDWQYDARKFVMENSRVVYFWIMPANFSGEWESADGKLKLTIHQQYQIADLQINDGGKISKEEDHRILGKQLAVRLKETPAAIMNLAIEGETIVLTRGSESITLKRTANTMEPFTL